jgi:AbrB family looped-hinge helix DNA binding protein
MVMEMEVEITLDKQGRIVLPKEFRDKYHLHSESSLILVDQAEGLLIKPKPAKKKLKDIFSQASNVDLNSATVIDVANYHEDDI